MKTIEERAREIAERIERERYLHSQSNFDVDDATEIIASDLARAEEKGRREAEAKFWPIFMWLLGYTDWPERKPGEGAFYWRGKLRRDLENTITDFDALLAEKEEK